MSVENPVQSAYCRAFNHTLDGHTFLEKRGRRTVWVAVLECTRCGAERRTDYQPLTGQQLSRHHYEHEEWYDTLLKRAEARAIVFTGWLVRDEAATG